MKIKPPLSSKILPFVCIYGRKSANAFIPSAKPVRSAPPHVTCGQYVSTIIEADNFYRKHIRLNGFMSV